MPTPDFDSRPYWKTVKACLTKFHGMTPREAVTTVRSFRERLLSHPGWTIIYHEEQYAVANSLSGKPVERTPSVNEEYLALADGIYLKHFRRISLA